MNGKLYTDNKPFLTRRSLFKGLGLGVLWYLFSPFLRIVSADRGQSLFTNPPLIPPFGKGGIGGLRSRWGTHDSGSGTVPMSNKEERIGETFVGEELKYNMSFWWFKKAAEAKITFYKNDNGGYMASIEAETLGLIGFITRYRKDIYYSHLEEIEEGKRLRASLFEKIVTIGKKTRRGFVRLDYNARTMTMKSWGGGKPEVQKEKPIPPGITYDDPLTAFFNFRYGAYGTIKEGKEYSIQTFPKKGVSTIHIRITTEEEKRRRLNPLTEGVKYFVDVRLEKELFGSQTGNVEVLFSQDLTPLKGIVKDVIFFGDIRGVLVEEEKKG